LPLSLAALKYTVSATPMEMVCFVGAFVYGTLFHTPLLLILLCFALGLVVRVDAYLFFGIGGLAMAYLFHVALR
jgi:hypothetical protein